MRPRIKRSTKTDKLRIDSNLKQQSVSAATTPASNQMLSPKFFQG